MTEKELNEIKARAEAATSGPWSNPFTDSRDNGFYSVDGTEVIGVTYYDGEKLAVLENNADFIAHARTDIPALVAEVERLTIELTEANSTVDSETKWADDYHEKWQETEQERAKLNAEIERLRAQIFKSNETHLEMFAEIERLKVDLEGADAVALDYKKTLDRQNEYVVQLRNALTKIEALSTQWEGRKGAPWWNLGDIARKALKSGGE